MCSLSRLATTPAGLRERPFLETSRATQQVQPRAVLTGTDPSFGLWVRFSLHTQPSLRRPGWILAGGLEVILVAGPGCHRPPDYTPGSCPHGPARWPPASQPPPCEPPACLRPPLPSLGAEPDAPPSMLPTGPRTARWPVPWRDSAHPAPAAGAPFLPPSLPRLQQGFENVPARSALALAVPWGAGRRVCSRH